MRHSPFYRIFVIVLCYLLGGSAIFLPLMAGAHNDLVLWIALGVFGLAMIATIVIEEIHTHKKIKAMEAEKPTDE
ncbi:MAG: hypothetical protein HUJ60_01110 [Bacilli bacterium]|nr:hypothetical protein [Bacilli bacterium]